MCVTSVYQCRLGSFSMGLMPSWLISSDSFLIHSHWAKRFSQLKTLLLFCDKCVGSSQLTGIETQGCRPSEHKSHMPSRTSSSYIIRIEKLIVEEGWSMYSRQLPIALRAAVLIVGRSHHRGGQGSSPQSVCAVVPAASSGWNWRMQSAASHVST